MWYELCLMTLYTLESYNPFILNILSFFAYVSFSFQSDPDQGPEAQSPSPTDDVFLSSMSPPTGHTAPPPPYLPPQPSIEEARQQMHSLLDDAFALVSPSSQASSAGITLPGLGVRGEHTALSSPPSRGPRPSGPSYPAISPFSGVRYIIYHDKLA